jgi:hypothetical protein
MLSNGKCHYAEYNEYHYAEYHYDECHFDMLHLFQFFK